jgi:phosphoribosyl 1,2-cyclic phosphodiesterase
MKLKVLGSSSKGNCYILEGLSESLVLEAGIKFQEVKKALSFDFSKVQGVVVTHEHLDHAKYIGDFVKSGINVYASGGTFTALGKSGHRYRHVRRNDRFKLGGYTLMPFGVKHDADEPLGFLVHHAEMGTLLFATDTCYLEYKFGGLNHVLVESNYSLEILDSNVEHGKVHPSQRKRVIATHFEIGNTIDFLKNNDLDMVFNIVLLHLSDGNSNAQEFKYSVESATRKRVIIADKGLEVDLRLDPF